MRRALPLLAAVLLLAARPARADLRLSSWALGEQGTAPVAMPSDRQVGGDNLRVATVSIMVAATVALIAWDVYVAHEGSKTESQILTKTAWDYSSLPFLAGVLVGHWFFNQAAPNYNLFPVAIAVLAAIVTWDLVKPADGARWARYPGTWVLVGIGVGSFTWPQRGEM